MRYYLRHQRYWRGRLYKYRAGEFLPLFPSLFSPSLSSHSIPISHLTPFPLPLSLFHTLSVVVPSRLVPVA